MAYEPVVLMVFFGLFLVNGSFSSAPTAEPTIVQLPLMFPAMLLVLLVKLQKSPYDVAEAHTEIVSGPEVEYSGPYLGLIKYGHWVEAAVFFGIVSLLWGHPVLWVSVVGKVALVLLALFLVILIDNSSARLRFGQMARTVLPVGLALTALNAFEVWAVQAGVIPWP
jgi:ech hydrogenase subunit B